MITSTPITSGTDTYLFGPDHPVRPSTGTNAITVMVFCNTATPNASDETVNAVSLELHVVNGGATVSNDNCIVKNLIVPAGETVFFDTERLVLDPTDFVSGKLTSINGTGRITATVSTLTV